jgi:hypothetical protein
MNSISNEANQIILGGILGDGSINRVHKNPRIHFSHSTIQKEYIFWKYEILKEEQLVVSPPKVIMSGNNQRFPQWRFQTKTSTKLQYFEQLFYKNGKKVVQRKILNMLTPLGLAVWYMDDGNLIIHKYKKLDGSTGIKSREIAINTQCFSYKEHEIIQKYFLKVWKIDTKIYKNKGSYRLVMNATNAKIFISLIEPYVIPSMQYKIDLQYVK